MYVFLAFADFQFHFYCYTGGQKWFPRHPAEDASESDLYKAILAKTMQGVGTRGCAPS